MHVLITGATGYIGSAVLPLLVDRGHEVTAVVRSSTAEKTLEDVGAHGLIGDLADAAWLEGQLHNVDAAIHLAAVGADGDDGVITAIEGAFGGTDKRFVYTGGVWAWGAHPDLTEDTPYHPVPIAAWRPARFDRVLSGDYTGMVVVPTSVYGRGGGQPTRLFGPAARDTDGAIRLIGDGSQHWPTVFIGDLADLYVRALERGRAGQIYIAASGESPTVREMAEAGGATVIAETADETRARMPAVLADALLLDTRAFGRKPRNELGWEPIGPSLIETLRDGR